MATIGCDPEFSLIRTETGAPVSAIGLLGGSKKEPRPIRMDGPIRGLGIQEDNVMAELTVPPVNSARMFELVVLEGIEGLQELLPEGIEIQRGVAAVEYGADALGHPAAMMFGCDPDFDAYMDGRKRRRPNVNEMRALRFAGGHIHLGGTFNCPPHVAALFADLVIGTMGVQFEGDSSPTRRGFYGAAGCFRPKPYGIEYRTPDNGWTINGPAIRQTGAVALRLASWLEKASAGDIRRKMMEIPWQEVRQAINESDYDKASMLHNTYAEQIA